MKKKGAVDLVALGIFIALTVLIPATVKLVQQNQENRSRANNYNDCRAEGIPESDCQAAFGEPTTSDQTSPSCPCEGTWPNCKNCEPDAPPPPSGPCGAGDCGICVQDGGSCVGNKPNCSCSYPPPQPPRPVCEHSCANFCGGRTNACGEICNNPCETTTPPPPTQSPILPNGDLKCPGGNCDKCQKGVFWGAGCDDFCSGPTRGGAICGGSEATAPTGPDPNSFRCANGGGNCDQCGKTFNGVVWFGTGCPEFCRDHPKDAVCFPPGTTPPAINNYIPPAPPSGTTVAHDPSAEEIKKACENIKTYKDTGIGAVSFPGVDKDVFECGSGKKIPVDIYLKASYAQGAGELCYTLYEGVEAQQKCITEYSLKIKEGLEKQIIPYIVTLKCGTDKTCIDNQKQIYSLPANINSISSDVGQALEQCYGLSGTEYNYCLTFKQAPINGVVTAEMYKNELLTNVAKTLGTDLNKVKQDFTNNLLVFYADKKCNFEDQQKQASCIIEEYKKVQANDDLTVNLAKYLAKSANVCKGNKDLYLKSCLNDSGFPLLGETTAGEQSQIIMKGMCDRGEVITGQPITGLDGKSYVCGTGADLPTVYVPPVQTTPKPAVPSQTSGSCDLGATRQVGSQLQSCVDGKWVSYFDLNTNTPVGNPPPVQPTALPTATPQTCDDAACRIRGAIQQFLNNLQIPTSVPTGTYTPTTPATPAAPGGGPTIDPACSGPGRIKPAGCPTSVPPKQESGIITNVAGVGEKPEALMTSAFNYKSPASNAIVAAFANATSGYQSEIIKVAPFEKLAEETKSDYEKKYTDCIIQQSQSGNYFAVGVCGQDAKDFYNQKNPDRIGIANTGSGIYTDPVSGVQIYAEVINGGKDDKTYKTYFLDKDGNAISVESGSWEDLDPKLREKGLAKTGEIVKSGFDKDFFTIANSPMVLKSINLPAYGGERISFENLPEENKQEYQNSYNNCVETLSPEGTEAFCETPEQLYTKETTVLVSNKVIPFESLPKEEKTGFYKIQADCQVKENTPYTFESAKKALSVPLMLIGGEVGGCETAQQLYYKKYDESPDTKPTVGTTAKNIENAQRALDFVTSSCGRVPSGWSTDCRVAYEAYLAGDTKIVIDKPLALAANIAGVAATTLAPFKFAALGFGPAGLAFDVATAIPFAWIGTIPERAAVEQAKIVIGQQYGDGILDVPKNGDRSFSLSTKLKSFVENENTLPSFAKSGITDLNSIFANFGGEKNLDVYYQAYVNYNSWISNYRPWETSLVNAAKITDPRKQKEYLDKFNQDVKAIGGAGIKPAVWDDIVDLATINKSWVEAKTAIEKNSASGQVLAEREKAGDTSFKMQIGMGVIIPAGIHGLRFAGQAVETTAANKFARNLAVDNWASIDNPTKIALLEGAEDQARLLKNGFKTNPQEIAALAPPKIILKDGVNVDQFARAVFDDVNLQEQFIKANKGNFVNLPNLTADQAGRAIGFLDGAVLSQDYLAAKLAVSKAVGDGGIINNLFKRPLAGITKDANYADDLVAGAEKHFATEAQEVNKVIVAAGGNSVQRTAGLAPARGAAAATAPPVVTSNTVGMTHYSSFINNQIPVIAYDEVDEIMVRAARDLANGVDPAVVRKQATDALIAVRGLEENHVKIVEDTVDALVIDMRFGTRVVGDDGTIYVARPSAPATGRVLPPADAPKISTQFDVVEPKDLPSQYLAKLGGDIDEYKIVRAALENDKGAFVVIKDSNGKIVGYGFQYFDDKTIWDIGTIDGRNVYISAADGTLHGGKLDYFSIRDGNWEAVSLDGVDGDAIGKGLGFTNLNDAVLVDKLGAQALAEAKMAARPAAAVTTAVPPVVPATGTKTALPVASAYADQVPIAKVTYIQDESVYRDQLRKAMQAIEDALANGKTESEAIEAGRAIYLQRPLVSGESMLSPEFEWDGFGKKAADAYVRDYKRAVAVAGSTPVIAPQCVTGDTQLLLSNNDQIRIDGVKAGMSVMTYDEKSGKFIPSNIEALWDKGVQPIYKLTTETGKSIRTTSEHPYLVLEK